MHLRETPRKPYPTSIAYEISGGRTVHVQPLNARDIRDAWLRYAEASGKRADVEAYLDAAAEDQTTEMPAEVALHAGSAILIAVLWAWDDSSIEWDTDLSCLDCDISEWPLDRLESILADVQIELQSRTGRRIFADRDMKTICGAVMEHIRNPF